MRHALHYELVRLRTLRSTWLLVGGALALQAAVAFIYTDHADMSPLDRFIASSNQLMTLVILLPTAIAVACFGHEYRYRTITTTALTLRSRGKLLAAKACGAAGVAAVTATGMVGITLLAEALHGGAPSELGPVAQVSASVVVFAALCAMVGLGVAALTRNATVAMVTVLGSSMIIEGLLSTRIDPRMLPFMAARQMIHREVGSAAWTLPLPLLALAVVLVSASAVTLLRRDV